MGPRGDIPCFDGMVFCRPSRKALAANDGNVKMVTRKNRRRGRAGGRAADHVVAINDGVDDGDLLQALHGGVGENGHEAELDLVLLLELVLVEVAHLNDARHVDFVVGGEHGSGVLRLLEALGNALAHAGHGDASVGALCTGPGCRGGRTSCGGLGR